MRDGFVGALAIVVVSCSTPEPAGDPGDPDAARGTPSAPDAAVDRADAAPVEPETPWPDPAWPTGEPADHGFDADALDAAGDFAASIGSQCLLVVRDGVLVYERYFGDTTQTSLQKSWSIAKSFTSALVGIALRRGEIASLDQPAADFVPAWQGTDKEAITIRDLLSMSSGLHYDIVSDNTWTIFEDDHTGEAISSDLDDAPGSVWHYNNHGVQVLDAVLEAATGMDPEDYALEHLWGPIGMRASGPREQRTHWDRDDAGNATLYMSVFATCRDLARFGYLYQHGGTWNGAEILPAWYVDATVTPSTAMNRLYGLLWWVNGEAPGISSTDEPIEGTLMPFAPDDLFSAQGLGQSFIDVVPSTGTIHVHVRPAPHDPFTNFLVDPVGTMEAIFADGERAEHRELTRRLLEAGAR